jgi:hypothetical protein
MLNPINQTNPKYLTQFCPTGNPGDATCLMAPSAAHAWTTPASQAALQSLGFAQATSPCGTGPLFTPYVNFECDYGDGAGFSQALLPYPMFNPSESAGGLANQFNMAGSSVYNSLQASVQKRFSNGLEFLVNYTLSKNLSNTDSGFSSFNFGALNGFNQKAEWSIAGNDQTHILNMSGRYELPLGPGKALLNHGGSAMKNLLGGWQISGFLTYQSGTPLSITSSNNNDVFLNGFNRANYDPAVPLKLNWNNYYKGLPVFNTAAFSDPGFRAGNEPRNVNSLRTPFFANENVALAKTFFFGERMSFQLKTEFYNLFNRMRVCGGPDTNVNDANFGIINSGQPCQGITPRQGQLHLTFKF